MAALALACGPGDDTPAGLWRHHCARCHGLDGAGNPRAVSAKPELDLTTSDMLAAGDRAAITRRIARGKGTMPAFAKKLTAEQIRTLVDYTLELTGNAPPAAPPPNGGS